jgi:hypothetical protein
MSASAERQSLAGGWVPTERRRRGYSWCTVVRRVSDSKTRGGKHSRSTAARRRNGTNLLIALFDPGIEVGDISNPVSEGSDHASAESDAGYRAGVSRFPCEVDDEGADGEDDNGKRDATRSQRLEQQQAQAGRHDGETQQQVNCITLSKQSSGAPGRMKKKKERGKEGCCRGASCVTAPSLLLIRSLLCW